MSVFQEMNSEPNTNNDLESVMDLVDAAGRMEASTVVIAGGDRIEDLSLVESARDHGIVERIILVGDKGLIEQSVEQVGIDIGAEDIVAAEGYDEVAGATVDIVRQGQADIVLKGNMSTPILNRQMLTLARRDTVSLVTAFDAAPISDGKIMLLTDAGVTTVCNFERMVGMVENACDVARTVLGTDKPRVAILSANEKQIASLPSTKMGLELAQRKWDDAIVCGPLSFDLATDRSSVDVKGMPDVPNAEIVAGNSDILVCPGIDSANILYKTLAALNKYGLASLAGITVGFPVPYIIISRSDTMEIRLVSIALCSIYAQKTHQDKT
ncbi:MAG: phosphate acyltransferase [Planctomycetota bacterium]|jgi:phosphotransacetylase